ncbi:hypothetical protein CALCODRAFT_493184 [Calocera cornea HHB12733]|uniref:Peptidase M50B-like-domain-containing protein n=1 Tax=Calocera cornea HHB12733 TaxID=1353952 RepID=A0A165HYP5_9BASI|nr:hypothetical protein CALCODRAFT_493184 [Calocera cornea HHB12733]
MSVQPQPRPPVAPPIVTSTTPPLVPTSDQAVVLYVLAVYLIVIIPLWHLPGARHIITPLKLMIVGWHELCHVTMAVMTGGRILSITIDPNLGGATRVEGGHPPTILSAGYVGSTLFGFLLLIAGWDTLGSKVASWVIAIGLLCPLVLVRDLLTIFLTFCYEALLIGFWFIDHGDALRFYCLFVGVMSIFYVVWDISEDRFFNKVNDSDATQFSLLFPHIPMHLWAVFWLVFASLFFIASVLIGIASFKLSAADMQAQAAQWLPT